MYQDIFKKKKKLPRRLLILLGFFGGLVAIVALFVIVKLWWYRPIVIVRVSSLISSAGIERVNLETTIKNPDLPVSVPRIHGSLNIGLQNIGRSEARGISLSFFLKHCTLEKQRIYKSDSDCGLNIISSADSGAGILPGDKRSGFRGILYRIDVKELRPGSEVQLKYMVYKKDEKEPIISFQKASSSNAQVKVVYYR